MAQRARELEANAGRTMRAASDTTEGIQEVAENFYSAIEKSVRKQPVTTLGFAVAMGFILGAIWKS